MRIFAIALLVLCTLGTAISQEAVYFHARDGLRVRGDLYLHNNELPFIILCHQDGSNRTEYYDIAPRLLNLNYNCLAIDLRPGGRTGHTENALEDILAAVSFIRTFNTHQVILFGSSFSASLCMLAAVTNPGVKAVVAFNPGEYFQPRLSFSSEVGKLDKPVFVSATQQDYDYLKNMLAGIAPEYITLFKPEKSKGTRGVKALDSSTGAYDEYWFALMMFFKKLV
jgi:pimeloyl-ACP methyl ester carboxylesterase